MEEIVTKNEEETKNLAKKFAENLSSGDIVGLVGDLGGGKTTFMKGVAQYFRVKEDIQSPTFTLIREYKISKQSADNSKQDIKKLYHLDLYRLGGSQEVEELGLDELFQNKNAITFIEWADKIKEYVPQNTKWLEFEFIDENIRKIKVSI